MYDEAYVEETRLVGKMCIRDRLWGNSFVKNNSM